MSHSDELIKSGCWCLMVLPDPPIPGPIGEKFIAGSALSRDLAELKGWLERRRDFYRNNARHYSPSDLLFQEYEERR